LATRGGTSQPTIAAYEADRKSPSINTLRRLAASVGLEAMVEYHSPLTREDRRSLFLHRVIADRLLTDPDGVIAQARKNLARMSRRAATSQPLREWRVILDRPVAALATLLVDPEPWARELRHVTPFAGVLSGAERAALYRAFAESERLAP
jgi:transcriptional regulator with XRE-family HTH domain